MKQKRLNFIFITFLVIINLIFYLRSINIICLMDDYNTIAASLMLSRTNFFNLNGYSRPLSDFIFYLLYKNFGLNQITFHLFSLLLHTLNSILVFYFVTKISNSKLIGIISSLLFATYCLNYEPLFWIGTMPVLLVTFFILLTIHFFFYYCEKKRSVYLIFSLFSFTFALLSKEVSIIIIALILLLDFMIFKIRNKQAYVYFSLILSFWILINGIFISGWNINRSVSSTIIPVLPEKGEEWTIIPIALTNLISEKWQMEDKREQDKRELYKMKDIVFQPSEFLFMRKIKSFIIKTLSLKFTKLRTLKAIFYGIEAFTINTMFLFFNWLFIVLNISRFSFFDHFLFYLLYSLLLTLLIISTFRKSSKEIKKVITLSFMWIILTLLPTMIVSIQARHLYMAAIAASIIFAIMLMNLKKRPIIIVILCASMLFLNYNFILWRYREYLYATKLMNTIIHDTLTIFPKEVNVSKLIFINLPNSTGVFPFGAAPIIKKHLIKKALLLNYGKTHEEECIIEGYNIDIPYKYKYTLYDPGLKDDPMYISEDKYKKLTKRPNTKVLFFNPKTEHLHDVTGFDHKMVLDLVVKDKKL